MRQETDLQGEPARFRAFKGVLWILLLFLGGATQVLGGTILEEAPETPDPEARYLFYLHGRIIEDAGERPTHPVFGVYEYRKILEELAVENLVVVSEARKPSTDAEAYAAEVVRQVRSLLKAGVPPGSISVVGFSKGSFIAQLVSHHLEAPEVDFVLLGSCGGSPRPEIRLTGRVLAIYEESDELSGSCQALFHQAENLRESHEIKISTGRRHGAFYQPLAVWMDPVLDWSRSSSREGRAPR